MSKTRFPPKEVFGLYTIYDGKEAVHAYYITNERDALAIQKGNFDIEYLERKDFDDEDYILSKKWEKALNLQLDIKDIPTYVNKMRSVACCAFNATNHYIKSIIGGELVKEDNDWYVRNSLVTEHGLPQGNSFAVIQQLIEPYNLGISRIAIPPGAQRFELYEPFIKALGCNPFFLVDGITSNQEALERMFPDKEVRDSVKDNFLKIWRFECLPMPLSPSIFMTQFDTVRAGHNGGSSYRAPRTTGNTENWIMSIQVDRLQNINYVEPLVLPEYKEWEGAKSILWDLIKDKDGKTIQALRATLPQQHLVRINTSGIGSFLGGKEKQGLSFPPVCETCQRDPGNIFRQGKKLCQHCYSEQIKDFSDDLWNSYQGSGLRSL